MFDSPTFVPSVLSATVLAVLLMPGFIVNIPPLPKDPKDPSESLEKRVYRTGRVTLASVLVHALIFHLAFGAIEYFIGKSA
jgi:hypothetical protein